MTMTVNKFALRDQVEDRLNARAKLLALGWLGVACLVLMAGLGLSGQLFNSSRVEEHGSLIAVAFSLYLMVPVAIFLAAWKKRHLPYWALALYFLVMPLAIYFIILKWFDSKTAG